MRRPAEHFGYARIFKCERLLFLFIAVAVFGCSEEKNAALPIEVPRGFVSVLEIEADGQTVRVGPFVGYYFKPQNPPDIKSLKFVCFNENSFYTLDLPENAKLFDGDAILRTLSDEKRPLPRGDGRIQPVFFPDAPPGWLATRPRPQDEYVHFHSCYDATGPVRTGYWLRHYGAAEFTYDMGGRVGKDSPLHHRVQRGVDMKFPRIVEFDSGPERRQDHR